MASDNSQQAIFPLTVFDRLFERSAFVTGWLVEGTIDVDAIAVALRRVTDKWRMLAGRLDSIVERDRTKWLLKIPLGIPDQNYSSFALTSTVSTTPITQYIPIPIPFSSPSLPHSLFIHPDTPRQYSAWKARDYPLTCWHITHFPTLSETGKSYSCIGFARCHGVFDGVAAAMIVNALISELNGQAWHVPPLPSSGLNVNPLQEFLNRAVADVDDLHQLRDASGYVNVGLTGVLKVAGWHTFERWWRNAQRRIFIIPGPVITQFLDRVRVDLPTESEDTNHISTGDILVAWLMQTIYAQGTADSTTVHCTNFASFRNVASVDERLAWYPHNAFVPLPYPVYTVKDLKIFPLHELAHQMSSTRRMLSTKHVLGGYIAMLENPLSIPAHQTAQEAFLLSNVSASRILEANWASAGGSPTLCGYRYSMTPTELILTNSVYISGRLADSSIVLDTTLTENRRELLESRIGQMIALYNASKWLTP
ncbi:hypothetical protein BDP27DRAFT_1380104 [Rhodocollybia butyracea]|uniref:Uncharacterized protein n=1 Tax=Rhodocollybia butyracea TaxID=206335 RepID=A0A9P5Q8F7_9AGAR|nr:hypothetical protein BDP27DRAFT_1380104 [Rhodocollybia butyracea]